MLKMKAWRLKIEAWMVYRPVVAEILIKSRSMSGIRIRIRTEVKSWIWTRIKVKSWTSIRI
jgi:hypothetical protein